MNDDSWELLLTDELVDEFWDYCGEEDTVRLYYGNPVAEIEFINEVGLDQRIATSTVEAFLFLPESPLLRLQASLEASEGYDPGKLAKIVQWRLLQLVRVNAGQPTFDDVACREWREADAYPTSVSTAEVYPKYPGSVGELTHEAALYVAKDIVAHFPEVAEHMALVSNKSEDLGYRGLREVGHLTAIVAVIFNARRALLGEVGSKAFGTLQQIGAVVRSVWGRYDCQTRPHSIGGCASQVISASG